MIVTRPERPEDFPAIRDLIVTTFRETYNTGELEADLVERLRARADYDPSLALVALDGDQIIGHVFFSRVVIAAPGGDVPALVLAPLGVLKPYQRQGVGSRLARAGLERARALGYRAVFVQGSPAYYERFGFVAGSAVGLISPFQGVPDPVNMALEVYPGSLAGLSGRVVYPPEWDALM